MHIFQDENSVREAWLALAISAVIGAASAAAVAVRHLQQLGGTICGEGSAAPHCAACYIAPALVLVAMAAFGQSIRRPRPVMIGHDPGTESLRLARHGGRPAL